MTDAEPMLEERGTQPRSRRWRRWLAVLVLLLPIAGLLWVSNWCYQRSRLFTDTHVVLGDPFLPWGKLIGDENARELFGIPVELNLFEKRLTPYQMGIVGGYTPLRSLTVRGVTDEDFRKLEGLVNLEVLMVVDSSLTDDSCEIISRFNNLVVLEINDHEESARVQITDQGLKQLTGLTSLDNLDLGAPEVTDDGLKSISELYSLSALTLKNSKITGTGLKELPRLGNLQGLELAGSPLEGDCLKHLADCPLLARVLLRGSTVTDEMLDDLIPLRSLRALDLTETQVTHAGCSRFHEARPDVRIWYDDRTLFRPAEVQDK